MLWSASRTIGRCGRVCQQEAGGGAVRRPPPPGPNTRLKEKMEGEAANATDPRRRSQKAGQTATPARGGKPLKGAGLRPPKLGRGCWPAGASLGHQAPGLRVQRRSRTGAAERGGRRAGRPAFSGPTGRSSRRVQCNFIDTTSATTQAAAGAWLTRSCSPRLWSLQAAPGGGGRGRRPEPGPAQA